MPTDEQFIELLGKINKFCKATPDCDGCKFDCGADGCAFEVLADALSEMPCNWNMEEIERIIRL